MSELKKAKIADLIPDTKNFNKGNEFGNAMIRKSITECGLGRSIVLDKHGNIIIGNKTTEIAGEEGFEDVIIVPSNGKQLIAVQRDDLDINTPEGRKLAFADNRTSELNLLWDENEMKGFDNQIDFADWGFQFEEPETEEPEKEITSYNLTIECNSLDEFEALQAKLNTGESKLSFKEFCLKACL